MLRFCDSFDHYDDAQINANKWTAWSHGSSISIDSLAGRFGGNGLWLNGFSARDVYLTLPAQATWIFGFAFKIADFGDNDQSLMQFRDGASQQVEVRYNSAKRLTVTRAATLLGTGTTVLVTGRWYYLEAKVTINNTTGAAEVRLDGTTEINLTSQDTQVTANATADRLYVSQSTGSFSGNLYVDDLYMCDNTGGVNDTFLGDIKVEYLPPSGNGNSSQLVGSDGNSTDNYLLVDESVPNGDTDYVESSTVGDKDTYAYTNMVATTGTVFGLQRLPNARKTDAGTRKIASVYRLSGTEVDSADKTLSATYAYLRDISEAKPGGGSWTITDVNNAEFGSKVTA